MTCAFMALLCMIDNGDWQYIILPIGILIWGIFKFFDENDRKYLEGMGIDPDEFNAFFPDDTTIIVMVVIDIITIIIAAASTLQVVTIGIAEEREIQ